MKYAIIRTGGKQYKVAEGESILVDKLDLQKDSRIDFSEVLLIRTDDTVNIGNPYVKDGHVKGKILDTVLGEKVITIKFKAKVRYRRKMGFRPKLSKVLIESITLGKESEKKVVKKTIPRQRKSIKAA